MQEIYERVAEMCRRGTPGVVATVIRAEGSTPREAGAKMVIAGDGRSWGTIGGGSVEASVIREAASVIGEGIPRIVDYELEEGSPTGDALCGGRMEILMEPLPKAEILYVFGAGHVARPLVAMAKEAGFSVTVIDPRPELATRERFSQADEIVITDFAEAAAALQPGPDVYVVVVTPDHEHDEEVVRATLNESYGYVGMIGSRKKVAAVVSHLKDDGFAEETIQRLHSPIGLEIGAETPEEIAVSIVAELVAVRRGKDQR
jgi:xanthine dehydrogenase accessory factor